MFGNLFDDDGLPSGPNTSPVRLNSCAPSIPDHRGATNLCGIENLGATCYLNSLIQTLLFTPEFREGLMQLHLEPSSENNKIRVIPLELQKLFAQLLLFDVSSVSTGQLTESFGWTDHEELYQQQDVQELIRILFFAIQKSLVGTPGHDLISRLYQGTLVSQVQCQSCELVSVRDESYLDLTVAVGQNKTLKSSLYDAYCEPEPMTGSNQYLCPTCKTLTDANKVVKLRHLPPILTLSLLRFLYDPIKHQRFKDESRLEFPLELDMAPFCEEPQPSEVTVYELLSVIVHRGGAHGGHYHAIIQDIDKLGHWEQSTNPTRDMNLPTPEVLIADILEEQTDSTLTLEQLLGKIFERIGVPWSKSYKAKCGSIGQFLNSHCSHFFLEGSDLQATVTMISDPKPMNIENGDDKPSPSQPARQWFNFNDVEVLPVHEEDMGNYFEGEESAYMLVYRRKSLQRPKAAHNNPAFAVPMHIQSWVDRMNQQTEADRESAHLIWVRILPRSGYSIYQRSMFPSEDHKLELEITIDERESLSTFKRRAREKIAEEMYSEFGALEWNTFHWVQQSNFNLVIQDPLPDSECISLEEYKVENGQAFLVWNCDIDLDACDTVNNVEENWDYSLECQPLEHCTVVHANGGDEYPIFIHNLQDGTRSKLKVTQNTTVNNLRNMIEWEMGLNENWLVNHMNLCLGEDMHMLEPPLHDHLSMLDASIKPETVVYLHLSGQGRIQPNQVWLSYAVDDTNYNKDTQQALVIDSEASVASLVAQILHKAELDDDEAWHIGKTNMLGDVVQILNNPSATILSEKLTHGTHLVLRRGSALQRGLTRIKILELHSAQTTCPSKAPKTTFLGHVDMDTEAANLSDLRNKILGLLEERRNQQYEENQIRVRFLVKNINRPGKILRDNNLSLKSMDIGKNTSLLFQILPKEEILGTCERVLQVWRHIPGGCTYSGPRELIWDINATSLAEAVTSLLEIEQQNLIVAKYSPKAHRWSIIALEEDDKMIVDEQDKENMPANPVFTLNDGDILGIKDASLEKDDLQNFTTSSDLERWLLMEEEKDNRQRNNEAAAAAALEWTAAQAQSRMPERGIHIHVSDFC